MNTELQIVNPQDYGIESNKANELIGNLPQIKSERAILETQYHEVVQMDIEDKKTSQRAKELRSLIRDNRTKGILPWHKTTKEYYLRAGQFIDAIKNKEIAINERMEEALEQIEKHQAIKEAKEKEERIQARLLQLSDFSENDQQTDRMIVEHMSDDQFQSYLKTVQLQKQQRIEEQERLEKERLENERKHKIFDEREKELYKLNEFVSDWGKLQLDLSEAEYQEMLTNAKERKKRHEAEIEKQRIENERLKKAAQEREELTKKRSSELRPYIAFIRDYQALIDSSEDEYQKELAEIKKSAELQWKRDAELKAEQERLAAEERQRLAKLEAEQAAQKAKEEAEKKAAAKALKAPDKVKLTALADQIKNLSLPEVKSHEAKMILESVKELLNKTSTYIHSKTELM
jgi:hypothetical protein